MDQMQALYSVNVKLGDLLALFCWEMSVTFQSIYTYFFLLK